MLQEADTIGIFQVESRAQMATLPRLRPKCFYDIVVEVAIIRPGPIVGQMVHPYLKRRQGTEDVVYPHPALEPILARTLGVPLFQEQLLRMAMVAAGFSGGEAEELRRAMGFKRSEKRMQQLEGRLRSGMAREGIVGEAAEAIIRSITSFALYGFPESHAASFALLVYASAFLKAHYPAAFYTALLNNQPMGFYHPATLVKDAQRRGVRFASIDVQESDWECRVDPDGRVRLGLMYVNGLRAEVGKRIAEGWRADEHRPRWRHESTTRSVGPPRQALRRAAPKLREGEAPRALRNADKRLNHHVAPSAATTIDSMIEPTPNSTLFCNVCAHEWGEHSRNHGLPAAESQHYSELVGPRLREASAQLAGALAEAAHPHSRAPRDSKTRPRRWPQALDDLISRTGLRRDEMATLAEIGALNAFGHDRRSALWQIERAIRPAGELFNRLTGSTGTTSKTMTNHRRRSCGR